MPINFRAPDLRDPADISRCIVDVNWAPDLSIVTFMGPGSHIRKIQLTLTTEFN